ncbi:DNA repair protein rhp54 [Plakobranchus ocellatus]|uniref:DNA repair protein rhp54 n=1 Tax=Plakobranchus ocellatus TaxID=259542 RepID=A0AAV4AJU8_9GAST|nr:DNA repair protein rhp54 [Plakobranchus ocellatus]
MQAPCIQRMKSPQQGDLRLSGPPSGQGAGSGARTRDRRVPADLRADSQATVLPTPPDLKSYPVSTVLVMPP